MAQARDGLINEIRLLGGKGLILSTNIELRNDGLPYASRKKPADPGVAVYFQLNGQPRTLACDKWNTVEDNIQSLRKTIEALRGIERWGSSDLLERAFRGFEALPASASDTLDSWWAVLGVYADSSQQEIEKAYRELAKVNHPDRGGSHESMSRLNQAIAEARAEKGRAD